MYEPSQFVPQHKLSKVALRFFAKSSPRNQEKSSSFDELFSWFDGREKLSLWIFACIPTKKQLVAGNTYSFVR
jgi:hypothetical protein